MKKIFGLIWILALALSLSLFVAPVRAQAEAAHDVELSLKCTETADGDLRCVVTVEKNDGISELFFRVEYDDEILTLRERTFGPVYDTLDPDHVDSFSEKSAPYRAFCAGDNTTDVGTLVTLVFHAKNGKSASSANVKLVVREVGYTTTGSNLVYNEKYGAPVDASKKEEAINGGITVADLTYSVSAEGKISVIETRNSLEEPFTKEEPKEPANVPLIVGLAVGGTALIAGGIVGGYFLKKKKKKAGDASRKEK